MKKLKFGFDAPGVIFCLFSLSLISFVFSFFTPLIPHLLGAKIALFYFFSLSLFLFTTGVWMLYGTKIAKPQMIQKLAEEFGLKGHETVLDVGCGRGLFLIEIAKQLKTGKVHGIDLWLNKDQSGNALENTLSNVELAGVTDRIELHTADMRKIPFPDNTFDAVVSSLAIHNIKERDEALQEIYRVLKPKGRFAIFDIQHGRAYGATLKKLGAKNVEISPPHYRYCPPVSIVKGNKD